jgi:hypothetical protein
MEQRLNCYNYIFATCRLGERCPYGHVIVKDKDDYQRRLDISTSDIASRTSPRGKHSNIRTQRQGGGSSIFKPNCGIHRGGMSLDDSNCTKCKRIKRFGDLHNIF